MCKVSWCDKKDRFYKNGNPKTYCSTHIQYKKYAANASRRPWLMYKVEKIVDIELECELCGYSAHQYFRDRPTEQLAGLFDVDHIDSGLKMKEGYEDPSNYQLLCKQCHILKSYDAGDFTPKKYKK